MTTTSESSPDDFTLIDGIGKKTAKALQKAGVVSMDGLARLSVDDVAAALAAVDSPVSAAKIVAQRWLQQAWIMSLGEQPEVTKEEPTVENTPEAVDWEADDWDEHAGFFVYFDRTSDGSRWRTRIWDTNALFERQISGTSPDRWVGYILNRVDLPDVGAAERSSWSAEV